jgi:uncharacterized protein YoxC
MGGSLTEPNIDWITAIERFGLAITLVIFFVVTSWLRERRMAKRIDQLEKQVVSISNKLAAQTENTTALIKKENELMQEAIRTLSLRPCFAFESHEEFSKWMQWKKANE